MQQILTESHSGKTKRMINWSVSTFKGKLKFFRLKIVKYKTRAFNRKIEIQPIPIPIFAYREQSFLILLSVFRVGFDALFHRLCYKTVGSCFQLCTIELWSTWRVWRALKKLKLPPRATLTLLSCSPNFPHVHNSIVHAKARTNC